MRIPDIVRFWPIDGIRTISGPLSVYITYFITQCVYYPPSISLKLAYISNSTCVDRK